MVSCLAYSSKKKKKKLKEINFSETFNGLHGFIYRMIELSMTTAVRTSHFNTKTISDLQKQIAKLLY
jgi:hypothetical protein